MNTTCEENNRIVAIVFFPVLIFIQEKKTNYILNCFNVLFGFYSWVGYGKVTDKSLPEIKRSVLSPSMLLDKDADNNKIKLANLRYAKDYSIEKDVVLIWKSRKKLGF